MNNERKTLYSLAGLFIALVILVILQARILVPPEQSLSVTPFTSAIRLFNWSPEEIQALAIEVRDVNPLRLQRQGDQWVSVDSPQSINQSAVNDIALTLSELPVMDVFDGIEPERYAEFGLTRSDYLMIVQWVMQDGTPHAILVGNRSNDEIGYYVLVDERESVYILQRGALEYLAFAARNAQP